MPRKPRGGDDRPSNKAPAKAATPPSGATTQRVSRMRKQPSAALADATEILQKYGCAGENFTGGLRAAYERHLLFDSRVEPSAASSRERFVALARSVRDILSPRWLKTKRTYDRENPKFVYYISMEYLIGRSLVNNITNLQIEPLVRELIESQGLDFEKLVEAEPDAGLGNGGLGRLAACFIDSLATLQIPAIGYGLRYEYGMFRQEIENGYQIERPDPWLRRPDPWELIRPAKRVEVKLCANIQVQDRAPQLVPNHARSLFGIPYDRPIIGYGGKTINNLRLWRAASPDYFDLDEFNHGDFFGAVHDKVVAENLTRVLYPSDATSLGKQLRFGQEYFLVACSLADIIRRFRRSNDDWHALPDKVAIQLNDTHPSLAVAELMRILLDDAKLPWDDAWDLTVRTLAYTNHTLLPEALEKWPVELFEQVLPRHLEIIYEINRRFLADVRARYPGDEARLQRVSLIEEAPVRDVRMANLAIVGTHSTNGVAALHSELLRQHTVKDLAEMFPQRFSNKTNGVTPRRWILEANPTLANAITETIGDGWITDLSQLRRLVPLAEDKAFLGKFRKATHDGKVRFVDWLKSATGQVVDPDSIFDSQIKRIHEYKRQLLNVLHIIVLYDRLRTDPKQDSPPQTFFFSGKAAPSYDLAKLIIKLINNVAQVIDADSAVNGRLKVLFLPNYNVSLAERLIPASDVSEQISTAGYEASGTSNMKFMMNGALTIGTRDGATIEMAREAGEENMFLFGLTADQVQQNRSWYNPLWHYENEPETRQALDLIFTNHFSQSEAGIFEPIRKVLLTAGDHYMHLADLKAYADAQRRMAELYTQPDAWARKALLNVACSGKFSSDRAIAEYAADIWNVEPCPVA